MNQSTKIVIIGGGAAGFFFAANLPKGTDLTILEMGKQVLGKVRVSGGGRCNVTHACYDPSDLIAFYPRGKTELLGPFYHFGPLQMVSWLDERGVELKTEADGRMFPITNKSGTIVDCLQQAALDNGANIITSSKVTTIEIKENAHRFKVKTKDASYDADYVMIATGSSKFMWDLLAEMGHELVPAVPSLFTFKTQDHNITQLAGLSVAHARVWLKDHSLEAEGPLLITHWGFSGPGILRLSAWGARLLNEMDYHFEFFIDWLPNIEETEIWEWKKAEAKQFPLNFRGSGLPKRLWQKLWYTIQINKQKKWGDLNKKEMETLINIIKKSSWKANGKTTFKEEFVTAGGVQLNNIDFGTYESKIVPNLYLAGEVLNIDAITGGFNFQAAWTGAFIAAEDITKKMEC